MGHAGNKGEKDGEEPGPQPSRTQQWQLHEKPCGGIRSTFEKKFRVSPLSMCACVSCGSYKTADGTDKQVLLPILKRSVMYHFRSLVWVSVVIFPLLAIFVAGSYISFRPKTWDWQEWQILWHCVNWKIQRDLHSLWWMGLQPSNRNPTFGWFFKGHVFLYYQVVNTTEWFRSWILFTVWKDCTERNRIEVQV